MSFETPEWRSIVRVPGVNALIIPGGCQHEVVRGEREGTDRLLRFGGRLAGCGQLRFRILVLTFRFLFRFPGFGHRLGGLVGRLFRQLEFRQSGRFCQFSLFEFLPGVFKRFDGGLQLFVGLFFFFLHFRAEFIESGPGLARGFCFRGGLGGRAVDGLFGFGGAFSD